MSPLDHEHPVSPERVAAARAGVLPTAEAGRLAGMLGMLADPVRSRILFALSTWRWPWRPPRTRSPTR
jgi:ArsR family transcriptional regulator, lead/cadmium/zinc/bismuth-responsive transcriptional repressor